MAGIITLDQIDGQELAQMLPVRVKLVDSEPDAPYMNAVSYCTKEPDRLWCVWITEFGPKGCTHYINRLHIPVEYAKGMQAIYSKPEAPNG